MGTWESFNSMARLVLLLLVCLASTFATVSAISIPEFAHLGRTIPVHIPTQSVDSNDTFEVPSWLGAFYATVNASAEWILPLTIGSGGQTYPGEFLFVVNYGPSSITLLPQAPETITRSTSYVIQPGTTAQLISGYPDWTVVVASSSQIQGIYTFDGYDETTSSPAFTIEIGPDTYNPPQYENCMSNNCSNWQVVSIGTLTGKFNTGYRVNNIGYAAGRYNTGNNVNNIGYFAGTYNTGEYVNNLGQGAGQNNTATYVNNIGQTAGALNTGGHANNLGRLAGQSNTGLGVNNLGSTAGQFNTGANVNNLGTSAGQSNTGANVNNLGSNAGQNNIGTSINNLGADAGRYGAGTGVNNLGGIAGRYNTGSNVNNFGPQAGQYNTGGSVNNMGNQAGQNNTGSFCSHDGFLAGTLNTFNYCYTNGRESACTAANQFVFGASAYPLHLRLPSDTGSYCTGAAYDTCLNRAAANAWTFNAGTALRVPQYLGVGAATAPANTAVGAITTTKATPAVQAFGAVTANAASGVLAFTVSTAAVSCSSAVITNTNVVAGSEVILTIQKYTGTYMTNGIPMTTREDTAGSSVGSFTLNLCNTHATNALSGTLYVAFWVLN